MSWWHGPSARFGCWLAIGLFSLLRLGLDTSLTRLDVWLTGATLLLVGLLIERALEDCRAAR